MRLVNQLTVPRGDVRYIRKEREVACLSTDSVGDWVCRRDVITATGRLRVTRANPQDIDFMPAIGLLVEKSTPTTGIIQMFDITDYYTGLDLGQPVYFLGVDGRLSYTKPVIGPLGYVFIQIIGSPVSDDLLLINSDKTNIFKKVA